MLTYQKALIANTDLYSAQVFVYPLENYHLAIIISGRGDNIFLKTKEVLVSLENDIRSFTGPAPSLFQFLSPLLLKHLNLTDSLEILLSSWTEDLLYLQRFTNQPGEVPLPEAHLLRNGKIQNLSFSSQNQLISGYLKPGDKVLLANSNLNLLLELTSNPQNALEMLLVSPPDTLQDQLASFSLNQENEPPVALLLLDIPLSTENKTVTASSATEGLSSSLRLPDLNKSSPEGPSFGSQTSPDKPKPRLNPRFIYFAVVLSLLIAAIASAFYLFRAQSQNSIAPSATPAASDQPAISSNSFIIDSPETLISLDLIKDNFSAKRLSLSLENLLLLDTTQKSLVSLNITQKNPTILSGNQQLSEPLFASINGDFAFSYSPSKGVVRVNVKTQKDTLATPKDPQWGRIVDIYAFGSNFYLLDADKGDVWKYVPIESGYSDTQSYLKEGVVANFSDARKMEIDSSVWILKGLNEIVKYTSGSQDYYGFSDLPEDVGLIQTFFVSDATKGVYFIDKDHSKLLVTDKQGKFIAQYSNDLFKDVLDLVVDEKTQKIYLLDSTKLYQIDIQHTYPEPSPSPET